MTKTSILISAIAVAALCTPAHAKPPKVRAIETPFFVTMMVGDPDVVAAKSGPLELVVRCVLNETSPRTELLVRSSVDGWALGFDAAGQVSLINLPASEHLFAAMTSASGEFGAGDIGGAMAPTGHVMLFDTTARATAVFGPDCVVAGVVTSIKGELP